MEATASISTAAATSAAAGSRGPADLVEERLVLWYFIAAASYMLISMTAGVLMGLQLIRHNPLPHWEVLSPGRWRMVHTNAIAYGFIANGFLGMLHWVVPRLTRHPVFSRPSPTSSSPPGSSSSWRRQSASCSAKPRTRNGETPVWIDPVAQLGLLLVAINFGDPILRVKGPMYVTLWYFLSALVWTFLTYAMGNFVPQYCVTGSAAGAVGGLFIHDLVGAVRHAARLGDDVLLRPDPPPAADVELRAVARRVLGLAFFYPLQGIHHFPLHADPDVPAVRGGPLDHCSRVRGSDGHHQLCRDAAGDRHGVPAEPAAAVLLYRDPVLLPDLSAVRVQVTMTFRALIHFTDWVVGHAHMVMFGVFSLWQLGMMTYLVPKILRTGWYREDWCRWHYWGVCRRTGRHGRGSDSGGAVPGVVVGGAAAVGELAPGLDPVLVGPSRCRVGDVLGPDRVCPEPVPYLAAFACSRFAFPGGFVSCESGAGCRGGFVNHRASSAEPGPGAPWWGVQRACVVFLALCPPEAWPVEHRRKECVSKPRTTCRMPPHQPAGIAQPAVNFEGVLNAGPQRGHPLFETVPHRTASGGKGLPLDPGCRGTLGLTYAQPCRQGHGSSVISEIASERSMFESKSGIFLVAGIGFFALAFLSNAAVPALMYRHLPEKSVRQVVNANVRYQFEDLAQRFPEPFRAAFGPPANPSEAAVWYDEKCAEALEIGRKVYVGEGCWHCHSQFVRPVSNEDRRWGLVSKSWEYQNEPRTHP